MTAPAPTLQSHRASLAEALANVGAGFGLALILQWLAYPLFGIAVSPASSLGLALIFTAASLLRSYLVRRLFVAITRRRETARHARQRSLAQRLATGRP